MSASRVAFAAQTEGAVALVAATAKTILNVIAASGKSFKVTEVAVGFDGVTSSAVPVLVELCRSTQAGAGSSSAVTPRRVSGDPNITVDSTAAKNYSAEPTTLTPMREWLLTPNGGLLVVPFPLGREAEAVVAQAIAVRCTAPAGVNVRGYIEFEE